MKTLKELINEAGAKGTAIGHFNISDMAALEAIFQSARELNVPVIIGTSEGERKFIGPEQAAALIKSLRNGHDFPIFLNADHTHSFEKIKEAVNAGYDAVLFDGGKLPFEENIRQTKEVVEWVRSTSPNVLVEGEIGYIGSSSEVMKEIPAGAALKPEDLTTPEQAKEFVEKTGVDMLAPAVGNIHGIIVQPGFTEKLDIERIAAIKQAVNIPLVLHGGSGLSDDDFRAAIKAGINIVHINTEIRQAWRQGMEEGLKENPDEIAPYKIYPATVEEVKKVVDRRLRIFSGI
ncbi:MAG TPA: class II fructose-bisphosphate aldolase [Candidatus Paceibacterota bacterium]|nr:class II fructose-bisphosphate aldolase [Candidatus Paceibacterota bacterium]